MRATDDFKVFRFEVLHVAWPDAQRKRRGQVLVQLSSRLHEYEENRANLFGLYGVCYGILRANHASPTVLHMQFS